MKSLFNSVTGSVSRKYESIFKEDKKNKVLMDTLQEYSITLLSQKDGIHLMGSLEQLVNINNLLSCVPDLFFEDKSADIGTGMCKNILHGLDVLTEIKIQTSGNNVHQEFDETSQVTQIASTINYENYPSKEEDKTDMLKLHKSVEKYANISEISELEIKKFGFDRNRGLNTKSKYYELVNTHKYQCDQCSFKTKRQSHMAKHVKMHEENPIIFSCPQKDCNFKCIRNGDLTRHNLNVHSDQSKVFKCNICSYKTSDEKCYGKHMKYGHKDKQLKTTLYECAQCPYKTLKLLFFARHMNKHGIKVDADSKCEESKTSLKCELCPYEAKRIEHINRHCDTVHSDERKFLCQICGIGFKRNDALKQHYIIHSNSNNLGETDQLDLSISVYKCEKCDKVCRSKSALTEHILIHENQKTFKCEFCNKCFNTANILHKHKKSIHSAPGTFVCNVCGKKFNTHFNLKRHTKTHDKQKSDCEDKRFSTFIMDERGSIIRQENGNLVSEENVILPENITPQNIPQVIPIEFIVEEQTNSTSKIV